MHTRYHLPLKTAALTVFSVMAVATASGSVKREARVMAGSNKVRAVKQSDEIDVVHSQRVKFAAAHGVADPAALVAAVKYSPLANLLISVAIEESLGDPVAVGSSGELGAWQVKASDWGSVPRDIHGQAGQAERIISDLLIHAKGNRKKALARYNGGTTPPGKSYRYAERILKRAKHLQVAVYFPQPDYGVLRTMLLLDPPGNSQILSSFFRPVPGSRRGPLLS